MILIKEEDMQTGGRMNNLKIFEGVNSGRGTLSEKTNWRLLISSSRPEDKGEDIAP